MSGRYWDSLDRSRHSRRRDDDYHRRRSKSRDRHRRRRSRSYSRSKSRSVSRGRKNHHRAMSRSKSRSRIDRRRATSRSKSRNDRARSRSKSRRRHDRLHDNSRSKSRSVRARSRSKSRHRNDVSKKSRESQSRDHNRERKSEPRNSDTVNHQSSKHNIERSTESTLDGFDFASQFQSENSNNTQYIGGIESEDERRKIHEQMQERLRKLKESEPKRLVPTKPTTSVFTPFANDGSFLEKFKEMQDRFSQQQEAHHKEDERLRLLPMIGRRRGGKILKTGIVEKPKRIEDYPGDGAKDAWSLYLQEVKRYKNATCDPDAPSRSLVK